MNHIVHLRHSNVNNYVDKILFGRLFFLFFNIVQATSCPQLSENSVTQCKKFSMYFPFNFVWGGRGGGGTWGGGGVGGV